MSETLEERIRNEAKENFNLGTIHAFAGDLVELLDARDTRIQELEAALAGQHEIVCAYCHEKFAKEDPNLILKHIQTCEKRPEKAIFETWQRAEKMYQERISLLVNASLALIYCYEKDEDDDGFTRWGDSETPVFLVLDERKRDEALHALMELLENGPEEDNAPASDPKASKLPVAITSDSLEKVLEAYRDNFGVKTEKANEIHRAACEEVARLQELEPRNEKLEDALNAVMDWSKAYPLEIFPEPDLKKARHLLEAGDMTLDAISAHAMRHLLTRIVEIAEDALSNPKA